MSNMQVQANARLRGAEEPVRLVGIAALAGVFILPVIRHAGPLVPAFSPVDAVAAGEAEGVVPVAVVETPLEREQRTVAEYIAKRYRIADAAATHFVSVAYRAADQHRLDALLILAVMAIDSRYNPVAESVMGAKGLMQVIPSTTRRSCSSTAATIVLEAEVNILVGAQILLSTIAASAA